MSSAKRRAELFNKIWEGLDRAKRDIDIASQPVFRAQKECAIWLANCLLLGWPKRDLDRLEELWWRFHDSNGRLLWERTDEGEVKHG